MPELMDVYDSEKRLTGLKLDRKTAFLKEGQFMLYVLALIEDSSGGILITKRANNKKWAPGSWEIPGGGALAGESSYMAVCREVFEETGLDIRALASDASFPPIYSYRNIDLPRGDNYFVDIYHFRLNYSPSQVSINRQESVAWRAVSLSELSEINKSEGFLHYERLMTALKHINQGDA